VVSLALASGAAAASGRLALPAGRHAVGFALLEHRDRARHLPDGSARPVQVSIWYPARAARTAPLRYRDYVLVSARETSLAPLSPAAEEGALARYRGFLSSSGLPAAAIDEWLGAAMSAVRDARPAGGRFPVVLIATGTGGAVQDEAVLGELLASRGYVAATTPSPVRLGSRMESEADVLPRAQEQADDLTLALDLLRARKDVDRSRVAVLGYSFGARSALLLASRLRDVRALVSLEGGIGSGQAKDWLPPGFARGGIAIPILHVYGDGDVASPPDFALLESLSSARRWLVRIAGLRHLDFITFGLAAATLPQMTSPEAAPRREGLRAAHEYAAAFLDAHLLRRAAGAAWLAARPKEHGFPEGLVTLRLMEGQGGGR
jgi:dienelactone hydrolase